MDAFWQLSYLIQLYVEEEHLFEDVCLGSLWIKAEASLRSFPPFSKWLWFYTVEHLSINSGGTYS